MKRFAIVLLLAVVALVAYRFVMESRYGAQLEELGLVLDGEIAAYLEETWPRTPLPGEPVEGYALEWYERACRLGREVDEKLMVPDGWLDTSAAYDAEKAVDDWIESGKAIPSDLFPEEVMSRLEAWGRAFELAEKGTRCAEVGPRTSALASVTGEWFVDGIWNLRDMFDIAVAVDAREGRTAAVLRKALVCTRLGDDVARGGSLLESALGISIHERGGLILERLLADGKLEETDLAAFADALRAGLRDQLPEGLEGCGGWFWVQVLLRELAAGDVDFDELTGGSPSTPFEHARSWFEGNLSYGEILAVWTKYREIRDRLTAAAEAGPEAFEAALREDHGWGDSSDLRWFAPNSKAVVAPRQILRRQRSGQRLRDEARILACLALREIRRTGALPASIEEVRPPEVRPSPDGGEWRLVPGAVGKPASLQLLREGSVAHEIPLK